MQILSILRRWVVVDGPDIDFAATQSQPDASICINVEGVQTLGITHVPYQADGVNSTTGTLDLQLIDVSTVANKQGKVFPNPIITASDIDADVPVGAGLVYDVSGCRLVTVRIADSTLAGNAVSVVLYWRALA